MALVASSRPLLQSPAQRFIVCCNIAYHMRWVAEQHNRTISARLHPTGIIPNDAHFYCSGIRSVQTVSRCAHFAVASTSSF